MRWLVVLLPSFLSLAAFSQQPSPATAITPGSQAAAPAPTPGTGVVGTPGAQQTDRAGGQVPSSGGVAAQAAGGQQPPAQSAPNAANTIRTNVRLVILDAVVLDKQGHAVTDLKQEDFHVAEQDQPQQVRNFYAPGFFTPKPDQVIDSTTDLDRRAPQAPVNIVVLDEFNTRFEDMAFARYSLKKFLEKQPDRLDTPTMLVAVDLQHFTVLRDYTQNKDELINALDHHFVAYPWQVHQYSWIAERYATAFMTLSRVAEASVGHPGHKNMIWIGRGLPTLNRVAFDMDDQQRVNTAVQRTVNELRDARVTLYTIDPAGVMIDPGVYGEANRLFSPFGGDPDFEQLAMATGGRTLHGRNDVDAEIGSAIRDGSDVYSFSYRPANTVADPGKFRRIKVTVDRPGLTVYVRQGYYLELPPPRPTADGKVGRKLASELIGAGNSNMSYDAVHFTVHSAAADPNSYTVHLEPATLSWYYKPDNSVPRWTNIIVLVTTFDKKGKELKQDTRRAKVTAPASAPATGRLNIALDVPYKLEADPKATRARFVVRVEASGHMGTADVPLGQPADVSSYGAAAPTPAPDAAPLPAPPATQPMQ